MFPDQGSNPVPCVGRRILNHCATREAPKYCFEKTFPGAHITYTCPGSRCIVYSMAGHLQEVWEPHPAYRSAGSLRLGFQPVTWSGATHLGSSAAGPGLLHVLLAPAGTTGRARSGGAADRTARLSSWPAPRRGAARAPAASSSPSPWTRRPRRRCTEPRWGPDPRSGENRGRCEPASGPEAEAKAGASPGPGREPGLREPGLRARALRDPPRLLCASLGRRRRRRRRRRGEA